MLLNLQTLIAFAAMNVVIFHSIASGESYGFKTKLISNFEHWGSNGVDLFFVISGFILLYTQLEKKRSVKEFLLLRAIRIIPIYWLLTFILFFLYIFIPFVFREMVITWNWVFTSLLFMSNNLLGKPPVVLVGWTLELEMIFYLILGLSLWFKNWTTILTPLLLLITISLLSGNFILMEFVAGMFIALFLKNMN